MSPRKSSSEARERLLEAADRLFYQDGIRSVGIDKVIAEAGVAKMTLYSQFHSKDELILEVLRQREKHVVEFFQSGIEKYHQQGKSKLEALFATLKEWFQSKGFRGCAFINATVELADPNHIGTEYARTQRDRFNAMLKNVITDSLGDKAEKLFPAVSLLVEGAIVTAQLHGDAKAADVAWETVRQLSNINV